MRLILILFGTLISYLSCGQKYDLFEVSNNELIWQYTYEYSGPKDSIRREVVSMLKSKAFTQHVVRNELGYTGELRHYLVDCKRYGRSYSNTPLIYWNGEWSGKFVVEVRDNRYRVTIYGLYFENKSQPSARYPNANPRKGFYMGEIMNRGKTAFKKNVLADMALMSLSLRDAFDIKKYDTPIDEW
ncbi:MAG: hypothetical protein RI909_2269 [Bacteroidota bacterium]|jgi:hypothetical protein